MSVRARLWLAELALVILLLGLTPYPRPFAEAMLRAEAHRAAREYGAALAAYQEAAFLDMDAPQPWLRMGEVFLAQHRFTKAAIAFREAERLGDQGAALLGLGESYAGRGDWAAAMGIWLRGLEFAPDQASLLLALGRGSIAQGSWEQAASYLTRALAQQPTRPEVVAIHSLLGRLLIADDPDRAADHLRLAGDSDLLAVLDAAQAEPDRSRRALLLGIAFLQRNELPLARYHLERAVQLDPTHAEARAYLAHALDRMGHTGTAGPLLQSALQIDPGSVLVHYFLGVHYRRVGNLAAAQAALWEALQRDPENAALRIEMGESFVQQGDYLRAEEWYQAAVEVAPQEIEFRLLLAHFYLDHLYRVEAGGLPAAQEAVALAPEDARAHDLLGWAYHLTGQYGNAVASLSHALELDPDLVSAHYHLGSLYASTGQRELARRHLQRASDLDTTGYYRQRAELLVRTLR